MPWIDTHAHLFDTRFANDLPAVLARARDAQLVKILAIGIDRESSLASLEQARTYPMLAAAVGIQPNHVAEAAADDWDTIVKLASEPHVVAIGETGLDRYWDRTPFAQQEEYFDRHLTLAHQLNKAVVIHCREAEADVVRMLKPRFEKHGPIRAVMHSFSGDAATAAACLAMGLSISFAGMVTYSTAANLRAIAKTIPPDRLLVETDCPYLAPVPKRGKRNEPAFVVHTGECVAHERGEPASTLGESTTRNAITLFGLTI
jgi:TatD DNase family protein